MLKLVDLRSSNPELDMGVVMVMDLKDRDLFLEWLKDIDPLVADEIKQKLNLDGKED